MFTQVTLQVIASDKEMQIPHLMAWGVIRPRRPDDPPIRDILTMPQHPGDPGAGIEFRPLSAQMPSGVVVTGESRGLGLT